MFENFLTKIGLQRTTKTKSVIIGESFGGSDLFGSWKSGRKMSAFKAMNLNTGWVYACVRAIAEGLANIQLQLFEVDAKGNYKEIYKHDILNILNKPNKYMTAYELKYQTGSHLELVGNSYWLLDGVTDENSIPTAIWPLNPKYIKPIVGKTSDEMILGYKYTVGADTQTYQPHQIMVIKNPDPNNAVEGIGTVQSAEQWIESDNYATEVNKKYFENGARLSGLLTTDEQVAPETMEYLTTSFKEMYSGVSNAYKVGMLPSGVKYDEMGHNPKEMDFANMQNVLRDKILAAFRVPKTILGVAESETNRSTAETANYVFAARTLKPKMQLIVEYLNEFFVPRFGENLVIGFVDPVPENREQLITEMTAALGSQPAISVNEARERYFGYGKIKNGDSVMTGFSQVPLGTPEKTINELTEKGIVIKAKHSHFKGVSEKKKTAISSEIVSKSMETLKDVIASSQKDITQLTDSEYENVYKAFFNRVSPYEKIYREKIQEINEKQVEEVIKTLPSALKSKGQKKLTLFDVDEWIKLTVSLLNPIATELFKKEADQAYKLIGLTPEDTLTPNVLSAIKRTTELMAQSYNETTLQLLSDKLTQGQQEGLSIPELTNLVSEIYEFSNEVRAEMVAKTEVFRIGNNATREAWEQSGVVKELKWYTAEDERVCEFCGPMHGKVISIDENFYDKGDTVVGTNGKTLELGYSDITGGSLHVNCRCYIRPKTISIGKSDDSEVEDELDEIIKELTN